MNQCSVCHQTFSRRDAMRRHQRNLHGSGEFAGSLPTLPISDLDTRTKIHLQHPFTMVVSGPSGSGKSQWTRKVLNSSLIQPAPQRVIWCYGQWQPLYEELKRTLPFIEFVSGIPDLLNDSQYIKASQRNIIIFDDLMSEAKCDQRIADLFTKGSHHRNISIIYLTQNLFPQGKACRDIALNTQYLVLFNNPIDRQQIATLARRIYPLSSQIFIKRFEEATGRPFGYLMLDLKSTTPEHKRLNSDIFDVNIDDEDNNVYSEINHLGHGRTTRKEESEEDTLKRPIQPPGVRQEVDGFVPKKGN